MIGKNFLLTLIFLPLALNVWGQEFIEATDLKEGSYSVQASSSSSMFRIENALVTNDGKSLSAKLTLSGKGYSMLFLGRAEEAENANADDSRISFPAENQEGKLEFSIDFLALNKEFDLAAFSKKKQKWYDRKVTLFSDGIAAENFFITPYSQQKATLADGLYSIEVKLSGGSGKASVKSPAKLTVKDGLASATLVWSSPNYDYMKVNNILYQNKSQAGNNSSFEIPVIKFDYPMPVIADTTAMGNPHEIMYTLEFKFSSVANKTRYLLLFLLALVPLILCIVVIVCLGKKKQK